jgi:hypothetical protein
MLPNPGADWVGSCARTRRSTHAGSDAVVEFTRGPTSSGQQTVAAADHRPSSGTRARDPICFARSFDRDTNKSQREEAIPIATELVPFLEIAMEASPSELVFPKPDGSMMREDVDTENVLQRSASHDGGLRSPRARLPARGDRSPLVRDLPDDVQGFQPFAGRGNASRRGRYNLATVAGKSASERHFRLGRGSRFRAVELVGAAGLEPTTPGFGGRYSIQMSYAP